MENWIGVTIASSAMATLFLSALAYCFRSLFKHWLQAAIKAKYDTELESHKAHLYATNNKEIESLKSSLQLQAAQQNITFGKLHERRVDAIANIHEYLIIVLRDLHAYISPFELTGAPSRTDRLSQLSESYRGFLERYNKGHIFLPRRLADQVSHLENEYRRISNQYTIVVHANSEQPNVELWIKLTEELSGAIQSALTDTQEAMRIALGDPPTSTSLDSRLPSG